MADTRESESLVASLPGERSREGKKVFTVTSTQLIVNQHKTVSRQICTIHHFVFPTV